MKLKTGLLAMFVLMVLTITTSAQMRNFDEIHKQTMAMYKERLALTEEQAAKIDELLLAQQNERMELFSNMQGDRTAMREKMTELTEKYNKKIDELLTEEQLKEMAKIREEQRQRRAQGGGFRGGM